MRALPKLVTGNATAGSAETSTNVRRLAHFESGIDLSGLDRFCANLCASSEWPIAQLWVQAPEKPLLRCAHSWFAESPDLETFCQLSGICTLVPGLGIPGRVWLDGKPHWYEDVKFYPRLPRSPIAEKCGIRCGIAVPILGEGECVAVLELFSREVRERDDGTLEFVAAAAARAMEMAPERKRETA